MKKRMIITIIALIVVFGGIFGFDAVRSHMMAKAFANFQPPPAVISTTKVRTQKWQPIIKAVGTLVAVNGVNITSEASGIVTAIYFHSGDIVQQGQRIVQLDNRAVLEDLKNYQAQLALAVMSYNRLKALYEKKAVSKSELDKIQAEMEQAEALTAKTQVLISRKMITAPFTGKIGIRQVNLGQFISPGVSIASLQSLNPLYAQFYLPEQALKNIAVGQTVQIQVDTYPDKVFSGKITAINAEVESGTRNILIQATIPNKNHKLIPGMFTNVKILLPVEEDVVTVPQTAIAYSLYGDSVFVVKETGKDKKGKPILQAFQTFVKVGERRGNIVTITQGLKPGEEIVTSGQLKLQNKMRVEINNSNPLNESQPMQ